MSHVQYNIKIANLCIVLKLGELVGTPEVLTGGLMHKMYAVETTRGKFAIKALNPQIMMRPKAMQNFINSERIANIAAINVPALPAKQFNGTSLQLLDNQYYLVFDWIEGRSLKPNEINKVHSEKLGAILADLHMTDFSDLDITREGSTDVQLTDWKYYLQQGKINNSVWFSLMLETIEQLYQWNAKAIHAAQLLASNTVISHRDLDSKNVMWSHDIPILIDWEASGHINPMQNLSETAIYWAEDETGNIDKERFLAFIRGYKKRFEPIQADWTLVLENGYLGMLGWLEYSLKRSLWIECIDEKEQEMGTAQVIGTINAVKRYADRISELEKWFNEESR